MKLKQARSIFAILIIAAAVLMIWESAVNRAGWGWQGIGAIVLCIASLAVHFKWVRCPHCGRPIARGSKEYCTYCGKKLEE